MWFHKSLSYFQFNVAGVGAGAEIILLINISYSQFGGWMKKNLHWGIPVFLICSTVLLF